MLSLKIVKFPVTIIGLMVLWVKYVWYLMGHSHAILNVIIGGGPLQSFPSNPTTIPSQDDAHHPPDLHSWESCDVLKSLKVYDEI